MGEGPTPEQQDLRAIGVATGLGCSIVATLILCIGGGVLLDRYFGTMPVLTLIGVALGLAAAAYQLWELAKVAGPGGKAGPVSRQIAKLPLPGTAHPSREPSARAGEQSGNEE